MVSVPLLRSAVARRYAGASRETLMCDIRRLIPNAMPRARGRIRLNIGPRIDPGVDHHQVVDSGGLLVLGVAQAHS